MVFLAFLVGVEVHEVGFPQFDELYAPDTSAPRPCTLKGKGDQGKRRTTYLLLRLDRALQESLNPRPEILHLLLLESLQLDPHALTQIVKRKLCLMRPALRIPDIRLQLPDPILLRPSPADDPVQRRTSFLQVRIRCMPQPPRALPLLKCLADAADEADVLVDDDAKGECVLLRLAGVKVADAELEVGEGSQGA